MSRYNNSRPRTGKEIPTKPARDKKTTKKSRPGAKWAHRGGAKKNNDAP